MKATKYLGALAAIAMFAACSSEDELTGASDRTDEVKINATVGSGSVFSRTSPVGTQEVQKQFNEGDKISVSDGTTAVVYQKTADGNWTSVDGSFLKWENANMTFRAFYPAIGLNEYEEEGELSDGLSANSYGQGIVYSNQTTSVGIAQADFMRAEIPCTEIPTDRKLNIKMQRMTARVIVNITQWGDEFADLEPTITDVRMSSRETVPYSSKDVDFTWVRSYKQSVEESVSKSKNSYIALVCPEPAVIGYLSFLQIRVTTKDSEKESLLYVAGIPALEAGKSYTYNLKVGKDKVTVEGVTVSEWETGDVIPGGEAEEVAPPYVTFSAEGSQTFKLSKKVETLEYSVNGGAWQTLGDDWITFGGDNGDLRLRGTSSKGTATNNVDDFAKISFGSVENVACTGDLRTLVDYSDYKNANTSDARFCHLFSGCAYLTTAPELPATDLADYCYCNMFYGCTSLEVAPALPATTLANYCYNNMFARCSALTTAPTLPAMTLADNCYNNMFSYCTSLKVAPALPATTLANDCYSNMFDNCTSLTTAPELPATTLANSCYSKMFSSCTNLEDAPVLPAETLVPWCYFFMFKDCNKLNSVTMLATNIDATDAYNKEYLNGWLKNTASSGTLIVANETMKTWFEGDGATYNPNNWTVTVKTEQE